MKTRTLRRGAAVMSAALLLSLGAYLPQSLHALPEPISASAAADDYPWSTYLKQDASWASSAEGIGVADDCIKYQISGEGGWRKGMATEQTGDWSHSTVDNDATTSQIRILMRVYKATGQQKYFDCAMRGVDCLFKMQYSNGGYMQVLNTPGTYHAHITLNDAAYLHILEIMKEMRDKTGDFTAVSDEYAQKAGQSLDKAIQCLLDMQIKVNGELTAWCQQHDENTLAAASARAYELPSVCTSESAGIVTFLYKYAQETGRNDIIRSVNAAIKWFQKVTLTGIKFVAQGDDKVVVQDPNADPLWARFYDIDKQIPLFSDRDSSIHYDVSEISQERRTGYAWYGNWGKNVVNLALLPETAETEPEYVGELVSKLTVHDTKNGANWAVDEDALKVGSQVFGDRDFTYVTLPNELIGAEYIRTACDSKTVTGDLATLTAAQDLTVYVMVDSRLSMEQGISPAWLSGWNRTGLLANTSNTVTFEIFSRDLAAGDSLELGSNMTGSGVVNYTAAVVQRQAQVIETTTTAEQTTTTVTETTTSEPVTEPIVEPQQKLTGDVDCSGDVNVADAVLLARFLAEDQEAEVSSQGKINAETNGAEGVTAEDNATLLEYLAQIITEFPV